ncbi:MAG: DUF1700 domain-containing protein [Tissierellaceae bacterium]|nr:DUF1700 domain-containing protein [Tissierellaceae bacterium]
MNRHEFLRQLRHSLYGLSEEEINDIILDYEEHFQIGLSKGKSEEEISKELGNPRDIARNYINTSTTQKEPRLDSNLNNNSRKFILLILLGLFNLIIVLGPYLGIVGILIGVFGLGIGLFFGGIGILFGAPFVAFGSFGQLHILTMISFFIGLSGLGILVVLLGIYLSKLLYKLTVRYIKWNIDTING